ncbi:PaaI family thioesterase [uncultured Enterovirga sp.]|uniref:PaaI family thioesterase n=1 Tax=uncultured Enterovirga sp. TaxID=2026352 RepID=UPI0035C9AF3E
MTRDEVEALLEREFPQLYADGPNHVIEEVGPLTASLRLVVTDRHLRPGGTVSGPAMMQLCDVGLYVAILANAGPVSLAVTTNLSFNFLRKPEQRDIIARCRLLKLGKRLAVGEVSLAHAGSDDVLCHAVGTYSIPPR